jgi:TctA family transporter
VSRAVWSRLDGSARGTFYGLGVALTPGNLLDCFLGALIGTIIGVLPGIGRVGALALLLPTTFGSPERWFSVPSL